MVEDGYEFFAKRQLVTLFSAPNYCGEFDNAGAMMSVDETLMCSFQVRAHVHTHNVTRNISGLTTRQACGVWVVFVLHLESSVLFSLRF